jgi:hypothetical protein
VPMDGGKMERHIPIHVNSPAKKGMNQSRVKHKDPCAGWAWSMAGCSLRQFSVSTDSSCALHPLPQKIPTHVFDTLTAP